MHNIRPIVFFLLLHLVDSNDLLRLLYNKLMDGYEREVRPAIRHDEPINVTFVFSLTQIIDLDERNQILTTNAWTRQTWQDYKLVWDPRLYDNLTRIHLPYERVWRPDIILYNKSELKSSTMAKKDASTSSDKSRKSLPDSDGTPKSEDPTDTPSTIDLSRMSNEDLLARKLDLEEKISLKKKTTQEYRDKADGLLKQFTDIKELIDRLKKEITTDQTKIYHLLQQNQRNKDATFEGLKMSIEEQKEKVKSVDDQAGETNRLLQEAGRKLRHIRRHEEKKRMSIQQRIWVNLTDIYSWISAYIRSFFSADSIFTKAVMSTDVIVDYLGNVQWSSAAIFKSSCPLDVKHYPFDKQVCTLKYASWAYDGTKIDLVLTSEKGDESNYLMSTEWVLNFIRAEKNAVVYSCCPEPYPFVDIHISIERRPMFYVFNLILPCVLISGIALLGFYMPSDSGEKVTLGITSLLSTTVFLMLVAEGMPPTSEALPLIGIYYGVTIFIVSLATAMTVFTLNVHHQGLHGLPVPKFLQFVAFKVIGKFLFVDLQPYHSITQHVRYVYQKDGSNTPFLSQLKPAVTSLDVARVAGDVDADKLLLNGSPKRIKKYAPKERSYRKLDVSFSSPLHDSPQQQKMKFPPPAHGTREDVDLFDVEFLKVMNMVHATIERNEMRVAEKDRRDAMQLEWQQVAMVLDRFLLVVFLIGTAISTFTILYQRELGLFE